MNIKKVVNVNDEIEIINLDAIVEINVKNEYISLDMADRSEIHVKLDDVVINEIIAAA